MTDDELNLTMYGTDGTTESITLTNVMLGLEPYVLIRVKESSDGSGDMSLFVDAGGGAEDDMGMLPALLLTELPAEKNPVTQSLFDLRAEYMAAKDWTSAAAIERAAAKLSVPMPEPE